MISLAEARAKVLAGTNVLPSISVALSDARGSVLRADLVAAHDTPRFDASAMDGYAVRSADLVDLPTRLRVVATSSCGRPTSAEVASGAAVRITTGAVVPAGADCVVPVERTDGGTDVVVVHAPSRRGDAVRRRGEVAHAGAVLVEAGTRLTAGHLGVAASEGMDRVTVTRPPRVAVVATGDELVDPGAGRLGPGQIYDSNSTLMAELAASVGCEVRRYSAADDPVVLGALLNDLAEDADVVLSSGGVSMGAEFDPLRAAVGGHPVEFWQVAVKPAKPLAFGHIDSAAGAAIYLGLPGNPNSLVVSFELFVRPLLQRLGGQRSPAATHCVGDAASTFEVADDGRTHLVAVRRTTSGTWAGADLVGSHALSGLAGADALAVLGPDDRRVEVGDRLELLLLWS